MRIISIIVSSNDCPIVSIDSFGVFEEQLVDEVVASAEKLYCEKAKELGIDSDDADDSLGDGYIDNNNGDTVSIVWSDI